MTSLILYSLLLSPLADFPVSHWLEPVSVVGRVRYIPAVNDPNMVLVVTGIEIVDRLDMDDFAEFSRGYGGN